MAWETRLARLERLCRRWPGCDRSGITHYAHASFPEMMTIIMRSGRVTSIQIPYSAATAWPSKRSCRWPAELGIGVLVMRPLGEGALAARPPAPDQLAPLAPFGVRTWAQALLRNGCSATCASAAVIPAAIARSTPATMPRLDRRPGSAPRSVTYVAQLAKQG